MKRVEDFAYNMLVNVLNAENTAPLAIELILDNGSHKAEPKARRIEDPKKWTPELIKQRGAQINSKKGPTGDFAD
jgi:fructose-bisphosphate aldolase class II